MKDFFVPYPQPWITKEIKDALGSAVWLLLYLLDITVKSVQNVGLIYGGQPMLDDHFTEALGISRNTLGRYRKRLEEAGFIYTRIVWGSLKQWFIIGSEKYTNKKATPKQIRLAKSVLASIVEDQHPDLASICNPYYFDILAKNDAITNNSKPSSSKTGENLTKNGAPNKDNTLDENWDDGERGMIGEAGKREIDTEDQNRMANDDHGMHEIHQVYIAYMEVMGSNSEVPNEAESSLIKEALEHEGLEGLMAAINNYDAELEIREDKWRVLALVEFFKRERYSRFLSKKYITGSKNYSPDDDDLAF